MADDSQVEYDVDCFQTVTYTSMNSSIEENINTLQNTQHPIPQPQPAIFYTTTHAPITYTTSNVSGYTQELNYSTTPFGSVHELHNVRRPSTKEDYYRLSAGFQQHNALNTGINNDYETGRQDLLSSSNSNHGPQQTYFKLSFFSFLLFFPIGIIALIKSRKAQKVLQTKNKEYAQDYSDSARFFAVLAIMMGLLTITIACAFRLKYIFDDGDSFFPSTR